MTNEEARSLATQRSATIDHDGHEWHVDGYADDSSTGARRVVLSLSRLDESTGREVRRTVPAADVALPAYALLRNRAMARKLLAGECVDVSTGARFDGLDGALLAGCYLVSPDAWQDGIDYCVALPDGHEDWIWSIGRERAGRRRYVAATDERFYPSTDEWECVWLR